MIEQAIEVSGVTKIVRDSGGKQKILLDDICFSVARNRICGLVGHNGAGKTTLIKAMLGLIDCQQGSVRIDGNNIGSTSVMSTIGYLPERPYFHEFLTGEEFLQFHYALVKGKQPRGNEIKAAFDMVGLAQEVLSKKLGLFSKGMLQRIGLAQALIHGPSTIILDEPLSGLDPQGREDIRQLIGDIAMAKDKTIILTSHVPEDLELLCDQVVILKKGRLVQNLDLSLQKEQKLFLEIVYDQGNRSLKTKICQDHQIADALKEIRDNGYAVVDIRKQSELKKLALANGNGAEL